jgi:hypothetical protein
LSVGKFCGAKAAQMPLEDLVQPSEFDLVFEARIIDLAVCLAAFR